MTLERTQNLPEQHRPYYITEESPEFQKHFEAIEKPKDMVFGAEEITLGEEEIARRREQGQSMSEEEEDKVWDECLEWPKKHLIRDLEESDSLEEADKFSVRAGCIRRFFEESLNSDEIRSQLQTLSGVQELGVAGVISLFKRDKIPAHLFKQMVKRHGIVVREEMVRVAEEMERSRQKFAERVQEEYITDGRLPITKEVFEKRLEMITCHLIDPLADTRSGDFQEDSRAVRMNLSVPPELRELVLWHELVHGAVGGFGIEVVEENGRDRVRYRKIGLAFPDSSKGRMVRHHDWLNEAWTEIITLMLQGKKDLEVSAGYKGGRVQVVKLMDAGVARELFLTAYCANYDERTSDEGAPEWLALEKQIRKAQGSDYLKRMERMSF